MISNKVGSCDSHDLKAPHQHTWKMRFIFCMGQAGLTRGLAMNGDSKSIQKIAIRNEWCSSASLWDLLPCRWCGFSVRSHTKPGGRWLFQCHKHGTTIATNSHHPLASEWTPVKPTRHKWERWQPFFVSLPSSLLPMLSSFMCNNLPPSFMAVASSEKKQLAHQQSCWRSALKAWAHEIHRQNLCRHCDIYPYWHSDQSKALQGAGQSMLLRI